MTVWPELGILAIICLAISFWLKRSYIWTGLIVGVVISTITAIIYQHDAINAAVSKKIVVVCVLAGSLYELISRLRLRSPQREG